MTLKRSYSLISRLRKSVYISLSKNVYTNLALEDWLYKNFDFKNHHFLLLWRNDPCTVIGAFQNPWKETNPSDLPNIGEGVLMARRKSGGGTVYHDNGNLNLSFFTTRKDYNRKGNLEFVQRLLQNKYNLLVDISPKSDLILQGAKTLGSASKLGLNNAYHHCSLLVSVDKTVLEMALLGSNLDIKTTATNSVRSQIINLNESCNAITVENLINEFKEEYLMGTDHFKFVEPKESSFPGLNSLRNELSSWDWLYGRTPKFTVSKFLENYGNVELLVEKGKVTNITSIHNEITVALNEDHQMYREFIGRKFDQYVFSLLKDVTLQRRVC